MSRRWLRFRLRTLLVFVLALSIAIGWLANERRKIAERREAILPYFRLSKLDPQPAWRVSLFGDDSPEYATEMAPNHNGSGSVTDATLAHL